MNQVFFKKLFVTDDSITAATLTDAYAELLADGLVEEIQLELAAKEGAMPNAGPLSHDRRSNETHMARSRPTCWSMRPTLIAGLAKLAEVVKKHAAPMYAPTAAAAMCARLVRACEKITSNSPAVVTTSENSCAGEAR